MSFKIAFIGAGSIGFTRGLLSDILSVPEFRDIQVSFHDISQHNLDMVHALCQRDIDANNLSIRIEKTLDRRQALKGAKYVINCMRVGMLEAFAKDVEIPLKYGVDQCVGDTLSAGGIFYGQRVIEVMKGVCRDIREVAAPNCLLLNYSNPNAMVTWYCNTYGGVNTVGLCHGVQGGHELIARVLGHDVKDVDIICAGINHMTWYISIKHKGVEIGDQLLPALKANPDTARTEKVRIDMMERFGYFSTESNGHLSEYVPWYRKRTDEIIDWIDLGVWINGETGGYLRVCTEGRNWFETDFPNWMKEPPRVYGQEHRGREHGSYIIEGLETGRIYRGHFNVVNNGCITNLPDDCVVEVPGYVDIHGINIPKLGDLPMGCAACCLSNVTVQRLAVHAALNADITLLRQAMMMDPLVGAVCNPREIWQMVDEMLIEEAEWLPQYKDDIEQAKARMAQAKQDGTWIPPIQTQGAARLHTKSVDEMAQDRAKARANAAEADKGQERTKG